MYIQKIEHKDKTLFLITKSLMTVEKYIAEHIDILAWIEVVYAKKIMHVNFIFTYPKFQNRGYASILLYSASIIGKDRGVFFIELDDMTKRSHKRSNFYIKHGLKYMSFSGPEMTGHLSNIKSHECLTDNAIQELSINGHTQVNHSIFDED